jgi:simple sugar transport system permease protein
MQLNFMKIPRLDRLIDPLLPLVATFAALLVGAVMLILMDANPVTAYKALYEGAFGTKNAFADTVIKATPLLLVGLGICISFRGGVVNVGGEGQMIVGGLATVAIALKWQNTAPEIIIPVCLVASFLAGALWGGIAGVLKAYFNVNEILSTIMLNQIAAYWMIYLVSNTFIDPEKAKAASLIPETERLSRNYDLPRIGEWMDDVYRWLGLSGADSKLWATTLMHIGVIIAIVLGVLVYIFLWRTTYGYRIRAVGKNPRASRYAGIKVKRYLVLSLMLSGGFAGLAGGIQVLGVRHRMSAEGGGIAFTGNAGFNGIVAALFGKLHPVGTIPASILFGALLVGGNKLQRAVQVPSALTTVLIGLVIVFVVSSDIWSRRRARRRVSVVTAEPSTPQREAEGVA